MDQHQVAAAIGARIRRARIANSMTLMALASRAGLSEAFLSRVERGKAQTSIANLVQLCDVLGLGLQDLLAGETRVDRTDISVYRGSDAARHSELESTGYRWHRVAGGAARDSMEVFHLIFPRKNRMTAMVSHPGQEHCYVLSGAIDYFVGGEKHHLEAGDSIFITSNQPHRAENAGEGEAHVLMTVAQAGNEALPAEWWRLPADMEDDDKQRQTQSKREKTS